MIAVVQKERCRPEAYLEQLLFVLRSRAGDKLALLQAQWKREVEN